ncbi:hypothetical protein [Streptomyces sp. NPDC048111]|uniref:hypothetical protein n=1 Tax=Streptomyces sp. NPDC048111 TaxID=3365500 RepID=UPI00372226FC
MTGCGDSPTAPADRPAKQLLDDANEAMGALGSVTIDSTEVSASGSNSSHSTTDRKSRCANKTTHAHGGGTLEQIRIDETDYVRPDAAYLRKAGFDAREAQNRWIKTPASKAQPGDRLASCPYEFRSFGVATKGNRVTVGGREAIEVVVHDESDRNGRFTFSIAVEGKPYILKVFYEGTDRETTTSFGAFDEPLAIRPPAPADVVDGATLLH